MVRPIPGTRKVKGMLVGCTFFVWSHKGKAAYKSQWSFLRSTQEGLATVRAGRDAVYTSAYASWFEWLKGPAPFFWNWNEAYQRDARDGQRHFLTGPLPVYTKPQKRHRDPVSHEAGIIREIKIWIVFHRESTIEISLRPIHPAIQPKNSD